MKQTPILFTPENARKVLADEKTQTRRIIKPQPILVNDRTWTWPQDGVPGSKASWAKNLTGKTISLIPAEYCPYGQPCDRLWVRETFWRIEPHPAIGEEYRLPEGTPTGEQLPYWRRRIVFSVAPIIKQPVEGRKFPSIHMPKWACRLWLELTAVRVERLQQISEPDAKAEVCSLQYYGYPHEPAARFKTYRDAFRDLWCRVRKSEDAWIENPWVWALTFKRITPAPAAEAGEERGVT